MRFRPLHPTTWASLAVYLMLLGAGMLEQFGKITNDTKTPLIEAPGKFLAGATTLWNPQMTMGELQNQAYGYLFPQGPFFLVFDLAGVPPWITERLWSLLIIVAAAEGARRVARAIGFDHWPAWIAGMAFALNARLLGQVATRSAEMLPTAMLPWMLLPVILAVTGRLDHRKAALFSVVAFMFVGSVNATATAAGLPLILIALVFGVRAGRIPLSTIWWWLGLLVTTSWWWASSLLSLNAYSPPFFDYVEDARTTTTTTGYEPALRGADNWVGYLYQGDKPNWPAGYEYAFDPFLVLVSGLLAAVGVIGLVRLRSAWRTPLLISLGLGMFCLTVAHGSSYESPLRPFMIDQLDGALALLRNVSKADPLVRLPIALGIGAFVGELLAHRKAARMTARASRGLVSPRASYAGVLVLGALVLSMVQPALALNLRTPGWTETPRYWHQTADFLEKEKGDGRAWVIPGAGFGVQTWGWTQDEPMQSVATTPWVTRSQVPLALPQTIRVLSRLEELIEGGTGSPYLGTMLSRLGIDHVVVRHDLDTGVAETTSSSLVAIALARSRGVERVAQFGSLDYGPAIEIYRVTTPTADETSLVAERNVVTVAGASPDAISAVGAGLVRDGEVAIIQGDNGWHAPADVVGDDYRLRERNFGRVHDAEGAVQAPGEPQRVDRRVTNYPANEKSRPVVARYEGLKYVDASSSQAWGVDLGRALPENAPYAAVDGDPDTAWRSGTFSDPRDQWIDVHYERPQVLGRIELTSPVNDGRGVEVLRWRISAGTKSITVDADPFTGVAKGDLGGVRSDRLRIQVAKVAGDARQGFVSIREVDATGLPAGRTFVVPDAVQAPDVDYLFSARSETRSCITTLLAPDCNPDRFRRSDETPGIDRTFTVPADGTWSLTGVASARPSPATVSLLDAWYLPATIRASSTLDSDPTVSARFAYDTAGTTSWMADPRDKSPTLTFRWKKPQTIRRISIAPPSGPAIAPTQAVLTAGREKRVVDLSEFGYFEPLQTSELTVTFTNPGRGGSPIGLSEISLDPAKVGVPYRGSDETGAICGYGPQVVVDGVVHNTKVNGRMGDVSSSGPLGIALCGKDIKLAAGEHRIQVNSTSQFQPVLLRMIGGKEPSDPKPSTRTMKLTENEDTHQTAEVGSGEASILVTTRNFNPGWKATLDGRELDVQMVDGWAQGWRIPEGEGGRVEITYTPERAYVIVLFGGLAFSALVLLLALVLAFRTRLRPLRPLSAPVAAEDDESTGTGRFGWLAVAHASRPGRLAAGVGAVAIAWVLGGLPALAAAIVVGAAVVVRRGRWLVPLAGLVMVAGAVVAAWQLRDGPQMVREASNLVTGFGFVMAMGAALPGIRDDA
ncbi:alpha-(1-_3)-arabinofuranosyltransferase domain-containing protein [Nocardioides sp. Root151]|uniref:alpha-(1->3)-arabinofuranosyltransferase domain-containing protein n=1 Tax=Nocardioides sp. Root151 TaxID=1736475 RepID=UPI0007033E32|nr:alpha-(1->3)-arabinofuranosyltransferase family protein [Nocardioides sp. Root151]KQZ69958.1 hypothetical protein ASD66_09710 [Nocardioides sp. Root151]